MFCTNESFLAILFDWYLSIPPENSKKNSGFMFSGGMDGDQLHEIGLQKRNFLLKHNLVTEHASFLFSATFSGMLR